MNSEGQANISDSENKTNEKQFVRTMNHFPKDMVMGEEKERALSVPNQTKDPLSLKFRTKTHSSVERSIDPSFPEKKLDSIILWKVELQQKMRELFKKDKKFTPLYRGSIDGYQLHDIHSKIDGKGETLVIVQSDSHKIFGGFTPIPWNVNGGGKKYMGSSFLFSVRDDESIVKL